MSSSYPPFGNASTRPCQHCEMLLPFNKVYCRNCGGYNSRHYQIILPPSLLPAHSGVEHHHQTTAQTQVEHNNGNSLRSDHPNPTPLADFPRLNSPLAHPVSLFNPSNQRSATIFLEHLASNYISTIFLEHKYHLSIHSRQLMRRGEWMVTSLSILRNRQKVRNVHGGALSG